MNASNETINNILNLLYDKSEVFVEDVLPDVENMFFQDYKNGADDYKGSYYNYFKDVFMKKI